MAGTFTSLHYHLVFSTKNRNPLIHDSFKKRLETYIGGIIKSESKVLKSGKRTAALLAIGGMSDHMHMLVRWPANRTVSDLMRITKSKSSGWLTNTFPEAKQFSWQEGYGGFSVSKSGLAEVEAYILNQEKHHATKTFQEEFLALLEKHEIEYDPNTIWL